MYWKHKDQIGVAFFRNIVPRKCVSSAKPAVTTHSTTVGPSFVRVLAFLAAGPLLI